MKVISIVGYHKSGKTTLVERLTKELSKKVTVGTVEAGFMTKDLAILIGPDQKWLSTTGFLDKVDANLKAAMAA